MKKLCLLTFCILLASCSLPSISLSNSPEGQKETAEDSSSATSLEETSREGSTPETSEASSDSREYLGSDGSKWAATLDPIEAVYAVEECLNIPAPESLTFHFHKDRSCAWRWLEGEGETGEYVVDYDMTLTETKDGYTTTYADLNFYERDISLRPNDWIVHVMPRIWYYPLDGTKISTGMLTYTCAAGEDGWPDLDNCWEVHEKLTMRRVE